MKTNRTAVIQLQMQDSSVDQVFRDKISESNTEKAAIKKRLAEIALALDDQITATEIRSQIQSTVAEFQRGFKKARPSVQKRLVHRVFQSIVADFDGYDLYYRVTEDQFEAANNKASGEKSPEALTRNSLITWNQKRRSPAWDLGFAGSSVDVNGRRGRIRTDDPLLPKQMRYQLRYTPR